MVRDSNIIMEDLDEARKQSDEVYTALISLAGKIASDGGQCTKLIKLLHELMEANGRVKVLENEFTQATGNSKW